MTDKEKAVAYDEAKERAKDYKNNIIHKEVPVGTHIMDYIFPELKESEDERIRQFLIHEVTETSDKIMSYRNMNKKDVLNWLEKQGDIIENNMLLPFKEYDNLMDSINKKKKEGYEAGYKQGLIDSKNDQHVQPKFKVGDTIRVKNSLAEYVITDIYGGCYHGKGWSLDIISADRSGDYELVEKSTDNDIKEALRTEYEKGRADAIAEVQKSAWSEEDEKIFHSLSKALTRISSNTRTDSTSINYSFFTEIEWLKSIKDRVQPQSKQEWSEEDRGNLLEVKCIIDEVWHNQDVREEIDHSVEELESLWNWLDNIWQRVEYPQNTWKPSELQIEALESATENCAYSEYQDCLRELIEQLKKLKE